MKDITLAALKTLTAEQLGDVVAFAVSEEIITTEELGGMIRSGRLDDLSDTTVGEMIKSALEETLIEACDLTLVLA